MIGMPSSSPSPSSLGVRSSLDVPCASFWGRMRCIQKRHLWMALMAFTVLCLTFQYAKVLLDVLETRKDKWSKGYTTLTVNESFTTLQTFSSVSSPVRERPGRERLLNNPTQSYHDGDKRQPIPDEDQDKVSGLLVSSTPESVCQPKQHIVFLKTHKTASSTVVNILYRYGDGQNLTFGLPVNKYSQFFYPSRFRSSFVEDFLRQKGKEFHIICNHMRFNKPELEKLMPKDTFYFSIMRHPVTMFESAFTYYKSIEAFSSAANVEDFLDRGRWNYKPFVGNNQHAHNNLAFDFGFGHNVSSDSADLEERVQAAVAAIERDFHLILITEYFDESMVLLKRALCWSLDDVMSFKLNSRSERSRRAPAPRIASKVMAWNTLDWRLYVHFNNTFWRRVDAEMGRDEMAREVGRLHQRREQLQAVCLQGGGPVDPEQIQDDRLKPFQYGTAVIQGYNLNPALEGHTKMRCQKLIMPELQYSAYLYSKQFKH